MGVWRDLIFNAQRERERGKRERERERGGGILTVCQPHKVTSRQITTFKLL